MKAYLTVPAVRYAAFLGLATLALACNKKSSNDAPAPTSAIPVQPTGNVGAAPQAPSGQQGDGSQNTNNGNANGAGTGGNATASNGAGTGQIVANAQAAVSAGGAPVGGPKAPVTAALQVGSFYQFVIPDDMHVTEYATTKTGLGGNGALALYRVTNDPLYMWNYGCNSTYDKPHVVAGDAAGDTFEYCFSTPPNGNWLSALHIANNHLEVAENLGSIGANGQKYIDINVFDSNYDYEYGRSMFEQLCSNSVDGIYTTAHPITLMVDFWGNSVQAQFVSCVANRNLPNPNGAFPSSTTVDVGSFMITSATEVLPDYHAFGHGNYPVFHNKNLLEVTIISAKTYPTSDYFAQSVQPLFTSHLQRIAP